MNDVLSRRAREWCVLLLVLSTVAVATLHASPSPARDESSDACLSQVRTAVSMVTLHLVDRGGLPPPVREEMMKETVRLWRAAGVHVTWSAFRAGDTAGPLVRDRSRPALSVIVTPDTPEAFLSGPPHALVLASILFVEGRPTTLIAAYPGEVQRLLEAVRMETRLLSERPASLRHRLMGRVLGRAIAHELGHFLFGSADHAPTGLMRARHRLDDLTTPFTRAFRVVSAQPFACAAASVNWFQLADLRRQIVDHPLEGVEVPGGRDRRP
jgi:hypothetical protein